MSALAPTYSPYLDEAIQRQLMVPVGRVIHGSDEPTTTLMHLPKGNVDSVNRKIQERAREKYRKLMYSNMYPYGIDFVKMIPTGNDPTGNPTWPGTRKMKKKLWKKAVKKAFKKETGKKYDKSFFPLPMAPGEGELFSSSGQGFRKGELAAKGTTARGLIARGYAPHSATADGDYEDYDERVFGTKGGAIASVLATAIPIVLPLIKQGITALAQFIARKIKEGKERREAKRIAKEGATIEENLRLKRLHDQLKKKAVSEEKPATTPSTAVSSSTTPVASETPPAASGVVPTKYQQEQATKAARAASDRGLVGFPNPLSFPKEAPGRADGISLMRNVYSKVHGVMRKFADTAGVKEKHSRPFIDEFIRNHAAKTLGSGAAKIILDTNIRAPSVTKPTIANLFRPIAKLNVPTVEYGKLGKRFVYPALQREIKGNGISDILEGISNFFQDPMVRGAVSTGVDVVKSMIPRAVEYVKGKISKLRKKHNLPKGSPQQEHDMLQEALALTDITDPQEQQDVMGRLQERRDQGMTQQEFVDEFINKPDDPRVKREFVEEIQGEPYEIIEGSGIKIGAGKLLLKGGNTALKLISYLVKPGDKSTFGKGSRTKKKTPQEKAEERTLGKTTARQYGDVLKVRMKQYEDLKKSADPSEIPKSVRTYNQAKEAHGKLEDERYSILRSVKHYVKAWLKEHPGGTPTVPKGYPEEFKTLFKSIVPIVKTRRSQKEKERASPEDIRVGPPKTTTTTTQTSATVDVPIIEEPEESFESREEEELSKEGRKAAKEERKRAKEARKIYEMTEKKKKKVPAIEGPIRIEGLPDPEVLTSIRERLKESETEELARKVESVRRDPRKILEMTSEQYQKAYEKANEAGKIALLLASVQTPMQAFKKKKGFEPAAAMEDLMGRKYKDREPTIPTGATEKEVRKYMKKSKKYLKAQKKAAANPEKAVELAEISGYSQYMNRKARALAEESRKMAASRRVESTYKTATIPLRVSGPTTADSLRGRGRAMGVLALSKKIKDEM